MNESVNTTATALDAGKALGGPIQPKDTSSVIVIPNGYNAQALEKIIEPYLEAPRRVKANVVLATLESFIQYVLEFKKPWTKIFAVVKSSPPKFQAIIDYHDEEDNPGWCEHRAAYAPEFTSEWSRWMAANAKRMQQVEFATFLEENQDLIQAPPGAELLELVQNLEGKNDIRCTSAIKLTNGKVKMAYEEDVELKGTVSTVAGEITFPNELMVAIAPFDGGAAYRIRCRLKYRIENRKITFWYECVDVHLIIKDAVKGITDTITEKLGITPLLGTP
jgi:uncharacterized protein YfdQ (DUF2303 family)